MSRFVDEGSENAQRFVEHSIDQVRQQPRPVYTGHCRYCGEDVAAKRSFCDELCRDDYDYEQTVRRRQGR